jgi:hypothetical protein
MMRLLEAQAGQPFAEGTCGPGDFDIDAARSATGRFVFCNHENPVGELVNFKRFKKRQERELANVEASSQRAKHGLTKAEKNSQRAHEQRTEAFLDQHLRDDGKSS